MIRHPSRCNAWSKMEDIVLPVTGSNRPDTTHRLSQEWTVGMKCNAASALEKRRIGWLSQHCTCSVMLSLVIRRDQATCKAHDVTLAQSTSNLCPTREVCIIAL